MFFEIYDKIYSGTTQWIDRFTATKYWQWKYVAFLTIYILITSCPNYYLLGGNRNDSKKTVYILKLVDWIAAHPFQNFPAQYLNSEELGSGMKSHFAKRPGRVAVPLFCRFLGLNAQHYIWIQHLLGCLFLWGLIRWLTLYTNVRIAMISAFMMANLFVVKWFYYDFFYYDSTAFLLMFVAIMYRNPLLIIGSVVISGFVDERSVIGSGGILLWWLWQESKGKLYISDLADFKKYRATWATIFGVLLVISLRIMVLRFTTLEVDTSLIGKNPILQNMNTWPIALFMTFEGAWAVILMTILTLYYDKKWAFLVLFMTTLLAIFLGGMIVIDLTRSFSYGFLLILFSLVYLYSPSRSVQMERALLGLAVSCVLVPTYYVYGPEMSWLSPLILKIQIFLRA
ncbi:hypothetical protein P1X15_04310 [Runella sp. MFBS21]|uniref:hypothetical protein n=1 Tax=Runella sp. MFBS21 TaxID=3034018 RepID=UPI0023F698F6|nr:hypothetical protein [Runella sp. MFBS21]MDF7816802.1 hypothetical protein [Runella sp. MFBS21]